MRRNGLDLSHVNVMEIKLARLRTFLFSINFAWSSSIFKRFEVRPHFAFVCANRSRFKTADAVGNTPDFKRE